MGRPAPVNIITHTGIGGEQSRICETLWRGSQDRVAVGDGPSALDPMQPLAARDRGPTFFQKQYIGRQASGTGIVVLQPGG
jgi:hypothetical protein